MYIREELCHKRSFMRHIKTHDVFCRKTLHSEVYKMPRQSSISAAALNISDLKRSEASLVVLHIGDICGHAEHIVLMAYFKLAAVFADDLADV